MQMTQLPVPQGRLKQEALVTDKNNCFPACLSASTDARLSQPVQSLLCLKACKVREKREKNMQGSGKVSAAAALLTRMMFGVATGALDVTLCLTSLAAGPF